MPYVSPLAWDAVDNSAFRPLSKVFAVDPPGAAKNVNAFDEVPDSAWFQNRIGRARMAESELTRGACSEDELLDGSTAAPGSVAALVMRGAAFAGSEVTLVDLDERRLDTVRRIAEGMARARGVDLRVTTTTDRAAGLRDAGDEPAVETAKRELREEPLGAHVWDAEAAGVEPSPEVGR